MPIGSVIELRMRAKLRQTVVWLILPLFAGAVSDAPQALAKPRGCFTKAEQGAEEMVRFGLRLREGARGCDADPYDEATQPMWEQIDKDLGPQMKQQTDIRRAAFVREFENDAENKLSVWDARIVFFYRNYPLSQVYCDNIKKLLTDTQKTGWNGFRKRAIIARDEIRMTYTPCDQ